MSDNGDWKWGETPPPWFMAQIAEALRLMAQNKEAVHGFDTKEFTFIQAVCPLEKSEQMAAAFAKAYLETMAADAPPASTLDYREFTLLAIEDLNKKAARRIGQLLDVAIAFGAIEHARGNPSLQDIEQVQKQAEEKVAAIRAHRERRH